MSDSFTSLVQQIKNMPILPGVYLFKDAAGIIIYIGKAKNLRARLQQYVQKNKEYFKEGFILDQATSLDHMVTHSELEAMLLEAKLIQTHQPKHNVIFRQGQPFLWLLFIKKDVPEFVIVRNQKKKGTYIGPFIDKHAVRRVYDFMQKTFRLKVCHTKIAGGCLNYHLGFCAGSCREDFNVQAYAVRMELAKRALQQGHKKFLESLREEIVRSNQALTFEHSRELHHYYEAFEKVFSSLLVDLSSAKMLANKDIWVTDRDKQALYLFTERDNVLKKKQIFYLPYATLDQESFLEFFTGYYRSMLPAAVILIGETIASEELSNVALFIKEWHQLDTVPTIVHPERDHYASLIRLAMIHANQLRDRQATLGAALKKLLGLSFEPRSIDCFDVSHKQGMALVGSCVRFIDGKPAPDFCRKFIITTVDGQDDYASLREIVQRRYHDESQFPDIIMIDGGKGQLNAVQHLFPQKEFFSLAKREETIFSSRFMDGKVLDITTYPAQILIALRDYAHHFAITFHRDVAKKELI